MIPTLITALRQIRDDLAKVLEPVALRDLCRSLGVRSRERLLDPVTTIHLFLLQILHGNTACAHLPRLAGRPFTASAYCQARSRLPLAVLHALPAAHDRGVAHPVVDAEGLWHGHRTWFLDGSGVSLPDTPPLQRASASRRTRRPAAASPSPASWPSSTPRPACFNRSSPPRCARMRWPKRPLSTRNSAPATSSSATAPSGRLPHLYLLVSRGLHGVFRMSQRRVVDFTPGRLPPPRWNTRKLSGKARSRWVRTLGPTDQVVEWYKPYQRPAWMSAEEYARLPVTLPIRETRYEVSRPGFRVRIVTLVSTLLDADTYPAEELAELYRRRWRVETDLRHLKTTLGMDVLHCETEAGVSKELAAFAIVYNLVRVVMLEAARRQGVPATRVSFVDALHGWRPRRRAPPCRG